jgi:hypothetical protein
MASHYRSRLQVEKLERDEWEPVGPPLVQPDEPLPEYATLETNCQAGGQQRSNGNTKKASTKTTFRQRLHKLSAIAGRPINKATNLIGAEGFWPSTVDQECNKAARILYSFTSEDPSLDAPYFEALLIDISERRHRCPSTSEHKRT